MTAKANKSLLQSLSPDLITKLKKTGFFDDCKLGQPNQVLVNEYEPGQGIDVRLGPLVASKVTNSLPIQFHLSSLTQTGQHSKLPFDESCLVKEIPAHLVSNHHQSPNHSHHLSSLALHPLALPSAYTLFLLPLINRSDDHPTCHPDLT